MEKNIEQLFKVYNTLLMISTRGEDTILMGQCLSALHQVLSEIQNNQSVSMENAGID